MSDLRFLATDVIPSHQVNPVFGSATMADMQLELRMDNFRNRVHQLGVQSALKYYINKGTPQWQLEFMLRQMED